MVYVVDQAIVPALRGRGIGAAIMRALMTEAEAAGLPVRLMVASDGEAARRFYLRLGFVPIRTVQFYAELEWRSSAAS